MGRTSSIVDAKQPARPKLARFLLASFKLKNGLIGKGAGKLALSLGNKIQVRTMKPLEGKDTCRAHVIVSLTFIGHMAENPDEAILRLEGVYQARYLLPAGKTLKEVDEWVAVDSSRDLLISQAYVLAMQHMKQQLDMVGVSHRAVDFSW